MRVLCLSTKRINRESINPLVCEPWIPVEKMDDTAVFKTGLQDAMLHYPVIGMGVNPKIGNNRVNPVRWPDGGLSHRYQCYSSSYRHRFCRMSGLPR